MQPAFVLLHFNDAYHIDAEATAEPVGGAARFATLVARVRASVRAPVKLTCGGDVFNPSLMSIAFKGKQMVPVLNHLAVDWACVGNHDFDFGADVLAKLLAATAPCRWLLTNVRDCGTGRPLVDALPSVLEEINGVRVGVFALIEPGWMETLTCDTSAFRYEEYVACGNATAARLRAEGAEFVVCLTHMREPEDIALCEGTTGIDVVLGGHDHFYACGTHNGVVLVKSGMDFRYATQVNVYREGSGFRIALEKHEITSDIPPDPHVEGIVQHYKGQLEGELGKVIGECTTELDARAAFLRTSETSIGNFVSDVMREEFGADVAIMNSGTIRSDNVYAPGPITMKTMLQMFPFEDVMVVVRVSGADVLAGLENGVSKYPAHEGRFPQVSGLRFTFDPARPPGSRVTDVSVGGRPLELDKSYSMVTKPYMLEGKDGYECFQGKEFIVDKENGQLLTLMIRNYFRKLHIAAALRHHVRKPEEIARDKFKQLAAAKAAHTGSSPAVIGPVKDGRIRCLSSETEAGTVH